MHVGTQSLGPRGYARLQGLGCFQGGDMQRKLSDKANRVLLVHQGPLLLDTKQRHLPSLKHISFFTMVMLIVFGALYYGWGEVRAMLVRSSWSRLSSIALVIGKLECGHYFEKGLFVLAILCAQGEYVVYHRGIMWYIIGGYVVYHRGNMWYIIGRLCSIS